MAAQIAKVLERVGSAAFVLGTAATAASYSMYDGACLLVDCLRGYDIFSSRFSIPRSLAPSCSLRV